MLQSAVTEMIIRQLDAPDVACASATFGEPRVHVNDLVLRRKQYFDDVALKLNDRLVRVRIETIVILGQQEPTVFAAHATAIAKMVLRDSSFEVQQAASHALRLFGDKLYVMLDDESPISRHDALLVLRDAGVGGHHVLIWNRHISDRYECVRMELFNRQLDRLRHSYSANPPLCRWVVCTAKRNFDQEEDMWMASMETQMLDIICVDDEYA